MQWPDLVNSCFLFGGAFSNLFNVMAIRRDRQIQGIHWEPTVLFSMWGLWDIYFFPHLGQFWSLVSSVCVCFVNLLWLGHVIYYKIKEKTN